MSLPLIKIVIVSLLLIEIAVFTPEDLTPRERWKLPEEPGREVFKRVTIWAM